MGRHRSRWSKEEIQALLDAADNGMPVVEVARAIGRTPKSVIAQAKRLNVLNRLSKRDEGYSVVSTDGIKRNIIVDAALRMFHEKYPGGTPHEHVKKHGQEAFAYWVHCLDAAKGKEVA